MARSFTLLAGAAVLAATLGGPAFSQGTPQTVSLMKVDPQSLATGYRASKIVGSTVVNAAGATVGTINDLIITANEKVPFAVLSVGGFLGMDEKYVVVPFTDLVVHNKQMMLQGATKASLASLPAFKYSTLTNGGGSNDNDKSKS